MKRLSFFEAKPELYEKTFGYRDFKAQVGFLDKVFKKNKVKKILDIACGHSPQGRMLAKRGYEVSGIDLSESLLELGKKLAKKEKIKMIFYKRDMTNFYVGKFDAAYIMFNSILHLNSIKKLKAHFKAVNKNLKSNGIYIIDIYQSPFKDPFKKHIIDRKINGIRSVITYSPLNKKMLTARFKMETYYKKNKYIDQFIVLMFLPLKLLKEISKRTGFELINTYSNFKFQKLNKKETIRYIAVLKKKK
jgi:SAM-dependent methyltransferase